MNSLQITVLIFGLVLIGLVLLYNWWQDKKAQNKLNQHFTDPERDPLLATDKSLGTDPFPILSESNHLHNGVGGSAVPTNTKIFGDADDNDCFSAPGDPLLYPDVNDNATGSSVSAHGINNNNNTANEPGVLHKAAGKTVVTANTAQDEPGPDPMTEAVIDIRFPQPVLGRILQEKIMRYPFADDKYLRYFVQTPTGVNHMIVRPNQSYSSLQIGLTLVNRNGPVNQVHSSKAMMIADEFASLCDASIEEPNWDEAYNYAKKLDKLCEQLDAQVGVSLLLDGPQPLKAVADIARRRGFVDCRHTLAWCNPAGVACFVMLFDGRVLAQVRSASVERIELLIDVPNSVADEHAFGKMVAAASDLASLIKAKIVDDQNQPLCENAEVDTVDAQLCVLYQELERQGLRAGSERSQRVFS